MFSPPSVPRRMWTAVGALLLLAALTALVALPRSDRDTSARQDRALTEITADDIPWPGEGQAAVTLEGSGQVLTHGAQRPVPIASLTKVMTAYVVLDGHPLRPGEEGPRIEVDPRAAHEAGVGGESTVVVTPATAAPSASSCTCCCSPRRTTSPACWPAGTPAARRRSYGRCSAPRTTSACATRRTRTPAA